MITCIHLDMSSFDSIRSFVDAFDNRFKRLDVLVHNAGMSLTSNGEKHRDDQESIMKRNYLGAWLLTHELIGLLLDTSDETLDGRIIIVSRHRYPAQSHAHHASSDNWEYAAILFVSELHRRLEGSHVTVYALHPGASSRGGIWNALPSLFKPVVSFVEKHILKTAAKGAGTSIFLATASKAQLKGKSGGYFEDCQEIPMSTKTTLEKNALNLWTKMEQEKQHNHAVDSYAEDKKGGDYD